MLLVEFIVAFVIAIALAYAFAALFDRRGPWGSTWSMALVGFLFILAAAMWIEPFGPVLFGVYFVPFLIVGFLFMLLMAAIPPRVPETEPTTTGSVTSDIALGFTFWLMIIAFAAVTLGAVVAGTTAVG